MDEGRISDAITLISTQQPFCTPPTQVNPLIHKELADFFLLHTVWRFWLCPDHRIGELGGTDGGFLYRFRNENTCFQKVKLTSASLIVLTLKGNGRKLPGHIFQMACVSFITFLQPHSVG